ncbi:hypothetical protein [Pseudobutyrivibrio xylanivorans]|uniref:Uncharacterized protein n=1 Tax=Pseudobutyrivibrio xylanivorans DSM 14809 TaxID=1123012 RepID=A0A1M6JUQ9_PSEXY|nr:hypothetical protein [Pseudobutyrivibrio xylanivorans]SHJ50428.1 hypothetical protein SAMN02745725_02688 [Pseudobutyrivibrio xylanivorans DSM 14809]
MLFVDPQLECEFDFGSTTKIVLENDTETQLAHAIENTLIKISNYNKPILLKHGLEEYNVTELVIPEKIYTYKEIRDLIHRNEDDRVKGILRKLGVEYVGPDNEWHYLYLKLEYFIFFMHYYIFPEVRFYDVYKEINRSYENAILGGGENGKYGLFIIQNIIDEVVYNKKTRNMGIGELDDWTLFDLAIMKYAQKFTEYIERFAEIDDIDEVLEKEFTGVYFDDLNELWVEDDDENNYSLLIEMALRMIRELISKNSKKKYKYKDNLYKDNPIYSCISFFENYDLLSFIGDRKAFIEDCLYNNYHRTSPTVPEEWKEMGLYFEDIKDFIYSEEFLNWCFGTKRSMKTKNDKIKDYNILFLLKNAWEAAERLDEIAGFINRENMILQEDEKGKYITAEVVAVFAWSLFELNENDIYISKNINIENRRQTILNRQRKLNREIAAYNRTDTWRGSENMPLSMFEPLILKAAFNAFGGEEKNFIFFWLKIHNLLLIELLEYASHYNVIERAVRVSAICRQIEEIINRYT